MSDTYVYEPDNGTRIDVAALTALLAGEPGDILEFVFNDTRVKYVVPDEDADLKDHVKALLTLHDAERTRADREAPPRLGDIVVYVGNSTAREWLVRRMEQTEYIVASKPGPDREMYCVEIGPSDVLSDWFYAWPRSLRVVRRASYRTVGE